MSYVRLLQPTSPTLPTGKRSMLAYSCFIMQHRRPSPIILLKSSLNYRHAQETCQQTHTSSPLCRFNEVRISGAERTLVLHEPVARRPRVYEKKRVKHLYNLIVLIGYSLHDTYLTVNTNLLLFARHGI